MLDSVVRALVFLDDLAELALLGLARRIRARWRALALVLAVGSVALCWTAEPPPVKIAAAFDVQEILPSSPGTHMAKVRYGGQASIVAVGAVLPDAAHPELVIAAIDCRGVNAVRLAEHSVVRRDAPRPHVSKTLRVTAVAGDHPNFVAVVEYDNETHIVQRGSKIPENGPTAITVKEIGLRSFEYWDHEQNRRIAKVLEVENQEAPTPQDLDLEGI